MAVSGDTCEADVAFFVDLPGVDVMISIFCDFRQSSAKK
jgi:hypothetical protein